MFRKIGRVIANNFGLKVLGVVFAIILWLAIINVADPNQSATYTIPVEILHPDYLAGQGMTYEILDNTDEITFTVEGPRSVMEELDEDKIHATADLEQINAAMTEVPIDLAIENRYSNRLEITNRQSDVLVQVEDLVTKEFAIEVAVEGDPEGECYVESAKSDPAVVKVTGGQSLVEQIDTAQASVSADGAQEDFTSAADIVLLDESGSEVDREHLTMDVTQAEVSVRIFMTKTVPLHFVILGEPAEGYWLGAPECNVDTVVIVGDASVIPAVEEIVVDSARLDVADADRDVKAELTLSNYLPEGVALAENEPDTIEVTLPVVEAATTEVEMPARNITVENLADDLELTIRGDSVEVGITGPADEVESVNGNRLSGTIDASGLGTGNYDLDVILETDGSYDAEATVSVSVTQIE